ncbi:MAG: NAD(P)/FAD-dependent oxidoreductase [Pseudomonadota bacterium]
MCDDTGGILVRKSHDVAVIGAGPVGCAAAIAFAQRGNTVLLLEANPRAAERFAGEWIHPSGVEILAKLGLDNVEAISENGPRQGFVAHPDDGSQSIVLPYPDGMTGVSFEHSKLVSDLRDKAMSMPQIDYVAPARLTQLKPQPAYQEGKSGKDIVIDAKRIVAADGRRSGTRRLLGLPGESTGVSFMAGIVLEDVDLPLEGFGHVMNGAPGPIMIYRIGNNRVRMCLDTPATAGALRRDTDALFEACSPALPPNLAQAFARSLSLRKPLWIETRFLTRTEYGKGNVALVGDAVGCTHPLTAAGISLGLMDVEALVESSTIAEYARRRRAETRVPEMLSNALYQVFVDKHYDAVAIRRSMFEVWRTNALERHRTMGMLGGTDIRGQSFAKSFFRIGFRAARSTVTPQLRGRDWPKVRHTLSRFASWGTWPLAGLLPRYRKIPAHLTGVRLKGARLPQRSSSFERPGGAR